MSMLYEIEKHKCWTLELVTPDFTYPLRQECFPNAFNSLIEEAREQKTDTYKANIPGHTFPLQVKLREI